MCITGLCVCVCDGKYLWVEASICVERRAIVGSAPKLRVVLLYHLLSDT